jgi:hypothetical protein
MSSSGTKIQPSPHSYRLFLARATGDRLPRAGEPMLPYAAMAPPALLPVVTPVHDDQALLERPNLLDGR